MQTIEGKKVPIKLWADHVKIEDEAIKQLQNLSAMPFIYKHVAVMPDAHWGMGSTVGSVIATQGAIIPAAVGVDIGCGMSAAKLPFKVDALGDSLEKLRSSIERSIPVGFNSHKIPLKIDDLLSRSIVDKLGEKAIHQIGTLGGGNHFIEICKDQDNNAWLMLHSGSRNFGKVTAERHIENAKGLMKQYFIELPDPDLAYFVQNTKEFDSYISDLLLAQGYAKLNRKMMLNLILKDISFHVFGKEIDLLIDKDCSYIDCHHNYTQLENHFGKNIWITRKGAVAAREGQYGIIPGSMGTQSFIVRGKGNIDSFCSCSHGAGRSMSRNAARKKFTLEDHIQATKGIECRKDEDVIDETPMAYKNINDVMASQADLVDIVYTLNQLICIKG